MIFVLIAQMNLNQLFQQNGGHNDFVFTFILGFLYLIDLGSNRIDILETFIAYIRYTFGHVHQPSWVSTACVDSRCINIINTEEAV